MADPKWDRSHDHLATISAAVPAGGRVFYIADEGSTAAVALPAKRRPINADSPPVLDGLIASGGRLCLVTVDGRVSCLGAR